MADNPIEQRPAGGQAMNLQRLMEDSIKVMAALVEAKDSYTSMHQLRVARLAIAIATEVHSSEDEILGLSLASAIHDIGKIFIPAEILSKPGKLTNLEFNIIREHPKVGRDILSKMRFYWPIGTIVYQHHERLDGSGYPEGLKGRTILPQARILAVADVVEAMSFMPQPDANGNRKSEFVSFGQNRIEFVGTPSAHRVASRFDQKLP